MELGVSLSRQRIGAGGGLSATINDSTFTWEDVEEEDRDMAAVIDYSNIVDNQKIVEDIEENTLEAYFNYIKKESGKVNHISISIEDFINSY
jgi:hypothetical protein